MAAQRALFEEESSLPSGFVHRPDFLSAAEESKLIEGIRSLGLREAQYKDFTAALVSEYRPGTALGWHRDVPHFEMVVGVSLASVCTMRFRPFPPRKSDRIFTSSLEPRSAYILKDDARWKWQHSISPTPDLRYSVTLFGRRGGVASACQILLVGVGLPIELPSRMAQ